MSNLSFPLVSVIVPCYNYGHFLPETIASLQRQKYQNWECIIVDDGSKDNTLEVCTQLSAQDTRIRYIHQRNGGLSNARNTGLKSAKGEYVQLLDADDMLGELKLSLNVDFLRHNPGVDIVYGQVQYFQHGRNDRFSCSIDMRDLQWMPCISGQGKLVIQELIRGNIMVVNAPMLRRSLMIRVGEFDEELRACEDWDYWIRCAVVGANFHYDATKEAAALVRTHAASMVNETERMVQASIAMRMKINQMASIRDKDVRRANMIILLSVLSHKDFQQLYQGNPIRGARGVLSGIKRWGNHKFFISNSLYWFRRRFHNS